MPNLPDNPRRRRKALTDADRCLGKTLRKLPSPLHALIYTTSKENPLSFEDEQRWSKMKIFSEISAHSSRNSEFERNERVLNVERYFPKVNRALQDSDVSFKIIDSELVNENKSLLFFIVLITAFLTLQLLVNLVMYIIKARKARKILKDKKNK